MSNENFLDLSEERNKVGFRTVRERLLTGGGLDTNKDAIIRPDNNTVLGVVTRSHDVLPYANIMDWMVNSFMDMNMPFDLKESVLVGGGKSLYQEYVSPDFEIDSPDANGKISPLVVVNASYNGSYLHIHFGVYRWSSTSSTLTGNVIDSITVRYKSSIFGSSISSEIKNRLDKFTEVSAVFRKLADESFEDYLWDTIKQKDLNFTFKKKMLLDLAAKGCVDIEKDSFVNANLVEEDPKDIITINGDMNAWEFYTNLMYIATHEMRSVSARLSSYNGISKVFNV